MSKKSGLSIAVVSFSVGWYLANASAQLKMDQLKTEHESRFDEAFQKGWDGGMKTALSNAELVEEHYKKLFDQPVVDEPAKTAKHGKNGNTKAGNNKPQTTETTTTESS